MADGLLEEVNEVFGAFSIYFMDFRVPAKDACDRSVLCIPVLELALVPILFAANSVLLLFFLVELLGPHVVHVGVLVAEVVLPLDLLLLLPSLFAL
eukprot:CAMPEP_0170543460 /NCGR_PEP_ID=MMETSP0211-20121228/2568_1 /TAXON_ID=311385 /ORGANISM="Pseudokeronopsis sp., Strain OXSARD2" /LENGTH=95 /DNA_ID=CAMNT_0010846837 /DNA_START=465 /DNA_END=749 /DNA_ORIENTATION=-